MPPRAHLPPALGWTCPQCTVRSFASSSKQLALGPEHPRYIPLVEAPQQTVPAKTPIKGILPVPRDVFAGLDRTRSDDEFLAQSTQDAKKVKTSTRGSRSEWKANLSEARKRNLREGVRSLRVRQQVEQRKMRERSRANQHEREELLHRPEREDERLTAPSTNLDLAALYGARVSDPSREERLATKRQNVVRHAQQKKSERLEALHTLYMNARDFIVTPEQLDKAVDEAFGTPEDPVTFGDNLAMYGRASGRSVWALGRPDKLQDMLNRATGQGAKSAMEHARGPSQVNRERMRRIAEALTGGKMEEKQVGQ